MSYEYDDFEDFYRETSDDNWWADKWEDEADEDIAYCTDRHFDHDREDFHSDDAIGYVDPFEDGPYID